MNFCPNCGTEILRPLPVEPMFTVAEVAVMIPAGKRRLERWLSTHKHLLQPASYTWHERQRRRLISASDVRIIRAILVSTERYRPKRTTETLQRRGAP